MSLRGGIESLNLLDEREKTIDSTVIDSKSLELSLQDEERYQRQMALSEIGTQGQQKLKNAKILVIGAGGLGCPALLYLGPAGIGTIGIADFDTVSLTNLHRQILYRSQDVGRKKTECAKERLLELNPSLQIRNHDLRVTADNVKSIIQNYDLVINGCDNFKTRYLLNDACLSENKILVDGSVLEWQGFVSVYDSKHKGCFRCLYPDENLNKAPSCADAGVVATLPGIIGLMQATEAIKIILGAGKSLNNRFLRYDALSAQWSQLKYSYDDDCQICNPLRRNQNEGNAK